MYIKEGKKIQNNWKQYNFSYIIGTQIIYLQASKYYIGLKNEIKICILRYLIKADIFYDCDML